MASWPRGAQSPAGEEDHHELRIDEDGDLSFYQAHVGYSEPVNGITQKVLSVHTIVGSVREFIAATVAISHGARVPGTWHIGIALTGIRGYRHRESGWPDYGPPCAGEGYVRVERFNLAAMERAPGDVAGKLLGRLLRGLRADTTQTSKHCSLITSLTRLPTVLTGRTDLRPGQDPHACGVPELCHGL